MRVYIAGPMRGIPDWNFPAFDQAEQRWRAAGHTPFSPAQIDRALKYGPIADGPTSNNGALRHVMQMDIACILAADAIALLPGWEKSMGSTVELALAQFLGLPVYNAVTMNRLDVLPKPWGELHRIIDNLVKEIKDAPDNEERKFSLQEVGHDYPREYDPDQAV